MGDADEPPFSTLAERIAALNRKSFAAPTPPGASAVSARPSTAPRAHRPPPPPPAAAAAAEIAEIAETAETAPPPYEECISTPARQPPAQPGVPPRLPPRLPPRRPSTQTLQVAGRRPSTDSVASTLSATAPGLLRRVPSAASTLSSSSDGPRKLPPAFGTTTLPPLPPSRREREADTAGTPAPALPTRPGRPAQPADRSVEAAPRLPPRLPSRPRTAPAPAETEPPALPVRRPSGLATADPQPPSLPARRPAKSALALGFGGKPAAAADDDDAPPPLPMASRPSLARIQSMVGALPASSAAARPASSAADCLVCRDFSAPDAVAARHPVASLPRRDTVAYLAQQLCGPFASPTDKARAIFTWCHHNIAYDVDGFFAGCVPRHQSLEERIFAGKAVCEGYAKVYEAVALAAGLACRVVTGHGKGFGFAVVRPGDPVPPPNPTGHAWNAVRIDNGVWKLVDACWGAGNVSDQRAERYEKRFSPRMFTMSNEAFGESHFPADPACFFRADGRAPSWAEYVVAKTADPPVRLYDNAPEQFIGPDSVEPATQLIHVSAGGPQDLVRFRFGRACPHWSPDRHGRGLAPYLMVIPVKHGGADGRSEEMVEMRYDAPMRWSADIPRAMLGPPGHSLPCYAFVRCDGRDMRSASMADFRASWGRRSVEMTGVCGWTLV